LPEGVPLEQVTEEHFGRHFDINVKSTVFIVQKVLPLLGASARNWRDRICKAVRSSSVMNYPA
jgi:NAD(P)-dependent dehydrogenase (short-subunit alcohol dehydrogenase family)